MERLWLNLFSEYTGAGHLLILTSLGGRVIGQKRHYPWFIANGEPRFQEVVGVEEVGAFLAMDKATYTYRPNGIAYKVQATHKKKIKDLAKKWIGLGKQAGMYNITYEVRASYDLQQEGWGILGFKTPLAFLPNQLMVRELERVPDVVGDLKVLAVDIEVYSRRGGFPVKGDPILSITYSSFKLKENLFTPEWAEQNVHYLLNPDIEDPTSSRKLVKQFTDIVLAEEPDIIVGYNTGGFDFPYMSAHPTPVQLTEKYVGIGDRYFTHVDLMAVRDSLGSSLNVRSQTAKSLVDVVLEVLSTVKKYFDISWIYKSQYLEAERKLDHAKLRKYYDTQDPLFFHYIVADVYFTSILARIWLYPLFTLSILTGIPLSVLQVMNTGQMIEYVYTELLTRLGMFPELKEREREFSRVTEPVPVGLKKIEDWWVFEQGKVYVRGYGMFGGDGYKVVELDFAQLYPTDMLVNTADPTSIYILEGYKYDKERIHAIRPTLSIPNLRLAKERSSWALLKKMKKTKKGRKRGFEVLEIYRVMPGYGPIAWFIYKLYQARNETKKLKKRAKNEGRPELASVDQAVKILNNSGYGAFSKKRGNLVNELLSASVFWRTQKLLYQVINAIETDVSNQLNTQLAVLYGDTDSAYILVPENIDEKELAKTVNNWVQTRYGKHYKMELEGVYKTMIIPKQKDVNSPSAKTYLCLDENMEIKKVKGEFFKLVAPQTIKERITDFYIDIIRRKPSTIQELEELVLEYLKDAPVYKLFIKTSISSYISDDDPARFKRLNRPFHYAGLVEVCENQSPGTSILSTRVVRRLNGEARIVTCRIDPYEIAETQRAIIVHYLPHTTRESTKFLLFRRELAEDRALAYDVIVHNLNVEYVGTSEKDRRDTAFVIEYEVRERELSRDVLTITTLRRIRRLTTETIFAKLVKAIQGENNANSNNTSSNTLHAFGITGPHKG